jgi:initiation factor 1A
MPKKGNKNKEPTNTKRILEYASGDGQIYALVQKALGDRTFTVLCDDNIQRRAKLRSKRIKELRKQPQGVVVIVSIRPFDEKTVDIIWAYNHDEERILRSEKIIPDWSGEKVKAADLKDDDIAFDFENI